MREKFSSDPNVRASLYIFFVGASLGGKNKAFEGKMGRN
jgi:hypothetical protein